MKRRVIIPAAGEAVRFGGVPKELLPINASQTAMDRNLRLALTVGEPVIVTSPAKAGLHRRFFPGVDMVVQKADEVELWGAIRCGLQRGVAGGVILADTVTNFDPWQVHKLQRAMALGVFPTDSPERFSVLTATGIVTKPNNLPHGGMRAWGVAMWDADVTDFFLKTEFEHYDHAFEAAMHRFGWETFPLAYYYDLGTFEAYREFLGTD